MRVSEFIDKVKIVDTPIQALAIEVLQSMDKVSFREFMREITLQERFASALRGFDSTDKHPATLERLDEE